MEHQMTLATEDGRSSGLAVSPGSRLQRDRKAYNAECAMRWHGEPLRDARHNWHTFEAHHAELVEILKPYLRDNVCEDLSGKMHNPDGTLTAWLWKNSEANPWLWSFCEHYQKCHLARGLIAYCKQVIGELSANTRA
jgi:hypothetical protein